MSRAFYLTVVVLLLSSPEVYAAAQDDDEDDKAQATLPADPSGKLYEKFELHRGFFISTDIGLMWAFGGAERAVSNTQPYVGLNMGYDINSWFSWQVHAGRGFNANSPLTPNQVNGIRDFAWTNLETGPLVWIRVWERLAIEVKLLGGVTFLDPVPVDEGVDGLRVSMVNPVIGAGLGLKYFTLLTSCTLGFEATFQYLVGANIPALNVSPLIIRYTF
jgi:hypothetical protein